MTALAALDPHMSVDEFLDWSAATDGKWQLVDGVPLAMAPTSRTHGTLHGELAALIRNHLRNRDSPCSVVVEPGVVPHIHANTNLRIPDLAVTCSPYDTEQAALADPVLIIELLSPSNEGKTWANVWAYTTIPSVREIVVVRTAAIGADLLRRGADGTWPREPEPVEDGDLVLDSIGLRFPLADLYQTTRLRRPPA